MVLPRIDLKAGGLVGVAAAVFGSGVQHILRSKDVGPSAQLNLCAHCLALVTHETLSSQAVVVSFVTCQYFGRIFKRSCCRLLVLMHVRYHR